MKTKPQSKPAVTWHYRGYLIRFSTIHGYWFEKDGHLIAWVKNHLEGRKQIDLLLGGSDEFPKAKSHFGITIISDTGTPLTTQVTGDSQTAIDFVLEQMRRGNEPNQTWDQPVIAAFIYDHGAKTLRRFEVQNGQLNEVF